MFSWLSSSVPNIPWQSIQLGNLIGNGSFGDVYHGVNDGRDVAVKVLQLKTLPTHLMQDFEKEINIMWQCKFDNIVDLYGVCIEPGHYSIVMEKMSCGSLYQFLHNPQQEISELQRWEIAMDIAKGLAYLHDQDILHRDLKSSNILLDDNYRAKISDFGLATLKLESKGTSTLDRLNGTVRWRAPELFKRRVAATKATDIYGYGMILWELFSRQLPFKDALDEATVVHWVSNGEREEIPAKCPSIWKKIIKDCWAEPEDRPSVAQIISLLEIVRPKKIDRTDSSIQSCEHGISTIVSSDLAKFLKHIGFGQQDEAEAMLIINPNLVLMPGTLTDCAKRNFEQITGFQYAVWALDWHMWKMLRKYMSIEALKEQIGKLEVGSWVKEHGLQISWKKLIDSLQQYVDNWNGWSKEQRQKHWCQQIGGAQLLLPAHVIDEYSHPKRPLHPCPQFKADLILPRIGVDKWNSSNQLGIKNAWLRHSGSKWSYSGDGSMCCHKCDPTESNALGYAKLDKLAMANLLKSRTEQSRELFLELCETTSSLYLAGISQISKFSLKQNTNVVVPHKSKKMSVDPQDLAKFLKHIGFGEQNEAEEMLVANPNLALMSGDLTDCAKRNFKQITGFQYAIWALDWHMWKMVQKYLPNMDVWEQVVGLENAIWAKDHGTRISWQDLIDTLQKYVDNYAIWGLEKLYEYWRKEVGGAQKLLPAHVINEYMHPTRPFHPCPEYGYGEQALPRTEVEEWYLGWFWKGNLGEFAWARGGAQPRGLGSDLRLYEPQHVDHDKRALCELLKCRKNQLDQLILDLSLTQSYHARITPEEHFQSLTKFLQHIGFGAQDEAEKMLKEIPDLALMVGDFTDCAGRQFKQVTGFQYAVWALDWHMWKMLQQYIPKEELKDQMRILNTQGINVKTPKASKYKITKQISWKNLIAVLQIYVENSGNWSEEHRKKYWCQQVGGEQLLLPAHVINEYTRPDITFDPCPTFTEVTLPRVGLVDWVAIREERRISASNSQFAWARGNDCYTMEWREFTSEEKIAGVEKEHPHSISSHLASLDLAAVSALLVTRVTQREQLISSIDQTHRPLIKTLEQKNQSTEIRIREIDFREKLIFSPPRDVSIAKINFELNQFLEHIGFGRQDEAEAMLISNPNLALMADNFKDCAKREFKKVTGFQYAVWALDWHMWKMLQQYIPTDVIREQLKKLDVDGIEVKEPENNIYVKTRQVSWKNLIDALKTFIDNRSTWNAHQRNSYWSQQIGSTQITLPAHVINEYSRSDRSFYPCPQFNEDCLPRVGVAELLNGDPMLVVCGLVRGSMLKLAKVLDNEGCSHCRDNNLKQDLEAISTLFDRRSEQRIQLTLSISRQFDQLIPRLKS